MGAKSTTITTAVRLKSKHIKDLREVKNLQLLPLFTRLQTIELQHNKIVEVPQEVAVLLGKSMRVHEYLQELNLRDNKLKTLPDEFFMLINLRILKLDKNELSVFPKQLLSFYRLEVLTMSNNKIKHLPWALNRLKRLQILRLDGNLIDYIPNTLGKVDSLAELQILPNPLGSINNDDVIIACHSGSLVRVLEFFLTQEVPKDYAYIEDIQIELQRKKSKEASLTDDQLILRKVLKNKKGLAAFEALMEKEHSSENIKFWRALSQFSRRYNSDKEITTEELINEAKLIFSNFIAEDSSYTLNLPAVVLEELKKIFTDMFVYPKGINQWVFKGANKAILDLISRDTFRRFKSSPEGSALIKEILEKEAKAKQLLETTINQ
eukprot:TRINITY_DN16678_c0_g1_i1.p1 TRINITY_DN16678_c0_g1~~TRINITY_DN16678_c0_g1_i1.p1  ORF type:complete len:390 (-),score=73.37 TRINITY_DN16678_c0_g1_i1:40-1176(-)